MVLRKERGGRLVRNFSNKRFFVPIAIFAIILFGTVAYSATRTSTATGGNWGTGSTWVGGTVPASGDNVIIANGATVTINGNYNCVNLTVGQGTSGILQTDNTNRTFSITGNLIVAAGANFNIRSATLNVVGATTISGSIIDNNNNGSAIFTGLISINSIGSFSTANTSAFTFGGGITNNGTFSKTGTGAVTLNNNQIINSSGTSAMTINGAVTVNGLSTIISGSRAVNFGNNITLASNVTLTNQNASIVTITGVLNGSAATSGWTNAANSSLIYNNATQPMATGNLTALTVSNSVTYSRGGAQSIKGSTYYNLILSGTNTKTLAGTVTVSNALTISSGVTFQLSTNNLTASGTTSVSGTISDNSATGTNVFAGLVTINSGGIWTTSNNPSFTFRGGITNNGTMTTTGTGAYTFTTNNQNISGANAITFAGSVQISGAVTVTNQNSNIVTVNGVLNGNNAASTWKNDNGSTLNYGNATKPFNTNGILNASTTSNTVNYNRNGTQIIYGGSYYNLTVSTGNTKTLGGNITVLNALNIAAGTLDVSTSNYSITITGNWTNTGTFTPRSGTATFNGVNQTITRTAGESFYRLIINCTGTVTQANGNVAVANRLTMTSGNINTGSYKLTLGTSTSNIGTLTYSAGTIIGKFERWLNATGTNYQFPVGTATNNNMAIINFVSGLTSGSLIVGLVTGDPGSNGLPLIDGSRGINVQFTNGCWNLTAQNSLACTNYNVALAGNGFTSYPIDAETRILKRTNGGAWTFDGSHTAAVSPNCYRIGMIGISTSGTQLGIGKGNCSTPSFTLQPDNSIICLDYNSSFSITASGTLLTYQWQENQGSGWNNLSNEGVYSTVTTPELNLTGVPAGMNNYQYRCVITDLCLQTVTSDAANLTVNTTTTWDGTTWSCGPPSETSDIIIAGNYSVDANMTVNNITVLGGDTLTVKAGNCLTVTGNTNISGHLIIESNATGDGGLIDNGNVTGAVTLQRYVTPNQWHLISPSISGAQVGYLKSINLKPYVESTDTYGSYITKTDSVLPVTSGYAVWAITNPFTAVYNGNINTGDITSVPLQRANQGYNLIGNPYPSPIDWEASGWTRTNISGTIWVWNGNQYATYTTGIGGTNGGSRYLSVGQGFFVQTTVPGNTVTFSNNVRVANSSSPLKTAVMDQGILRIKVSGSNCSDECLIAFRRNATNKFDDQLDAKKMFGSSSMPQLYSIADSVKLSVNVLNDSIMPDTIPFRIEPPYNGPFSIVFNNTTIKRYFLLDRKSNETFDLTDLFIYNTVLSQKDSSDRFCFLLKADVDTSTDQNHDSDVFVSSPVNISDRIQLSVVNNQTVMVYGIDIDFPTTVEAYNTDGRLIKIQKCSSCSSTEISPLSEGAYIIKVNNGVNYKVFKLILY